jgi:hypothetical protein
MRALLVEDHAKTARSDPSEKADHGTMENATERQMCGSLMKDWWNKLQFPPLTTGTDLLRLSRSRVLCPLPPF